MDPNETSFEMTALLEDDEGSLRQSSESRTISEYDFVDDEGSHPKQGKSSKASSDNVKLRLSQKPVDSYEGRHRFDAYFEWELAAEKKVVRKVCSRKTRASDCSTDD